LWGIVEDAAFCPDMVRVHHGIPVNCNTVNGLLAIWGMTINGHLQAFGLFTGHFARQFPGEMPQAFSLNPANFHIFTA